MMCEDGLEITLGKAQTSVYFWQNTVAPSVGGY